jgi:hypothetical protein
MANDAITTIIAALIGATIGSMGATFSSDWLKRKGEKTTLREELIQRYLLQLQEALESLYHRLDNIKNKEASIVLEDIYFEETTLYALGCVLAYRRILLLDGIYSQLHPPRFGIFLKEKMQNIDTEIDRLQSIFQFYRYDRLALAEALMRRQDNHLRTATYLEFKEQYEDTNSHIKKSLKPAKDFVSHLKPPEVDKLMGEVKQVAIRIGSESGIRSSLR